MNAAEALAQAFRDSDVECDWTPEGHATHAIMSLKAAGFKVVELPKPDHIATRLSEVDAAWSTWPGGDPMNDARWPGPDRVAVDGDEIELGGNNLLPDEAEALGLALLAAAGVARAAESGI